MDKASARYSDEELKEFRELVSRQREEAMREYEYLMNIVKNNGSNDTADTDLFLAS